MNFQSAKRAVEGEVQRTGASPSAAFRTLQLRQAALFADCALDRLNWSHCAYAGDDVEQVKALAGLAKTALDHALYGPNADPVEAPAEWMLPPTLEALGATVVKGSRS